MSKKENFGSDVSQTSSLCEKAMLSDSNIKELAKIISQIEDRNRIIALRSMDYAQIYSILQNWKTELKKHVAIKIGKDNFKIISNNESGNNSDSDIAVVSKLGVEMNIETKFGSSTNSASGVKRMSNIIGTPAFNLTRFEKLELINEHIKYGEESALKSLREKMSQYVKKFNVLNNKVNGKNIFDVIMSSGKNGNSKKVKNYSIINFRQNNGKGYISETEMTLNPNEEWDMECEISSNTDVSRLSYLFKTKDGQKNLKALFNNKNTLYVRKNKDGIFIPASKKRYSLENLTEIRSRSQLGAGSYNIWYGEGLEIKDS